MPSRKTTKEYDDANFEEALICHPPGLNLVDLSIDDPRLEVKTLTQFPRRFATMEDYRANKAVKTFED